MDIISSVTEEIVEELFKYKIFKDNELFFKSEAFKKFIFGIWNSKTEIDIKNVFSEMTKQVLEKTGIRFNYDYPIIWDNWGLDKERYLGSGGGVGSKFGFGSDTSFDASTPVDLKFLLEQMLYFVFLFKKQQEPEVNTIWEEIVTKNNVTELNLNVLGKVWLNSMEPKHLERLQIRCKSQLPFDDREELVKQSISVQESRIIPLILYASELAATYNLDLKQSIDFSKNKEYSEIQLITPYIEFKEANLIPPKGKTFLSSKLSLKNIVNSFEDLIEIKRGLSDTKQELGVLVGRKLIEGCMVKSITNRNLLSLSGSGERY